MLICDAQGYKELKKLFNTEPDNPEGEIGMLEIARIWKTVKKLFMGKVKQEV